MIRCGKHGQVCIRPTKSGCGRRVSSLNRSVTGVAYFNRGRLVVVWPDGRIDRDSPLSLGGAVKKLRSQIHAILARKGGEATVVGDDPVEKALRELRDRAIADAGLDDAPDDDDLVAAEHQVRHARIVRVTVRP